MSATQPTERVRHGGSSRRLRLQPLAPRWPETAGDAEAARTLIEKAVAGRRRDFAVELWDGRRLEAEGAARFTLRIHRPEALGALRAVRSDLTLGEAYVFGDVDVDGDLEALFEVGRRLLTAGFGNRREQAQWLRRLRAFPKPDRESSRAAARLRGRRSTIGRDRRAVTFHYERSNALFALFLDRRMVYSCAYFDEPDGGLDEAQERKLDIVCRKLRLRAGERLLDIGCGWGALAMHAAANYDTHVVGITLSRPQAELARQRIRDAGLADRCRIEVRDYRELGAETFDKVASVGMVEHVAPARLRGYFTAAWRALTPGGTMLDDGIATLDPSARRSRFISTYVFPDARLSTLPAMLEAAASAGFDVRDVESLGDHYAVTLRHWVQRLEQHRAEAVRAAGEEDYRIWRLYMAGSADAFAAGRLGFFQTVLAKPGRPADCIPLTHADRYQPESQTLARSQLLRAG